MSKFRLLVDTNVLIDYLSVREPFYRESRLLMVAGRVGEFDLWMTSSQVTDLIYILSNGGRKSRIPGVLNRLRGLRTFVEVYGVSGVEIDRMLASVWDDPEDALMYESALSLKADVIITRNAADFQKGIIPVMSCQEFFEYLYKERGLKYQEIDF